MSVSALTIDRNKKYRYDLYDRKLNKQIVKSIGHCLNCGEKEFIRDSKKYKRKYSNLNIHHIDGDKRNYKKNNLTVLCNKCHQGKAHILIINNRKIVGQLLNIKMNFITLEDINFETEKGII